MWFKWNQTEIAETLCENKDKPALNCNGKCVLSKKLAAAEKEEQQLPPKSNFKIKLEPTTLETVDTRLSIEPFYISQRHSVFSESIWYTSFSFDVFHPPKMS